MHQSVFPVTTTARASSSWRVSNDFAGFPFRRCRNGGRAVPLNVSGGFHSPFMESASARLHDVLETMDVKEPTVPVYANYTAEPYTKKRQRTADTAGGTPGALAADR